MIRNVIKYAIYPLCLIATLIEAGIFTALSIGLSYLLVEVVSRKRGA